MNNPLHTILIVGGGAGGLELATKLGRRLGRGKKARVVLVDAHLTHVWKPLYHEVAVGSLDASANEVNFRAHARRHHFEFSLGRLTDIDRERKEVVLAPIIDDEGQEVVPERRKQYDTLVIAIGSTANDFGTPGVQDNCLFLDTLPQARSFHRLMLNRFLAKEYEAQMSGNQRMHIAIIGAGATGVELAAELRLASRELPSYGLDHLESSSVRITVIEAGERILPALTERLSAAAQRELGRLNIEVRTGARVTRVAADRLCLEGGEELPADMMVWAAGIKAPEFLKDLAGLETNRANQLMVRDTLQTTLDPDIFAFGDCASCPQPDTDRPVPPRAQAAHQQASLLAKTLARRLQGQDPLPFRYRDHGSLISFSHYGSVGSLMGNLTGGSLMVEGKLARMFYISLYRMHQIALHGFTRGFLIWLTDKINRAIQPRLKLH